MTESTVNVTTESSKGYYRLTCQDRCKIEFHPYCWKEQKSKAERDKVTIIDTSAILAGRSTSGVTITPASSSSFKSSSSASVSKDSSALPPSLASSLAASGVTISSKSTPPSSSRASPAPSAPAAPASAFTYDSKGQLKDPNLTDDTIVIEAPSFIVPYVYEKPPKETFEAFKAEIKKLMDELKKEAAKQESEVPAKKEKKKKKKRKRKKSGSGEEDNGEREDDDDYDAEMEDDETDSDDSEIVEVGKRAASPELPEVKKPHENYFESTLGKFVSNLGMTLVQETVQVDLLRQQQKKAKKDKSAAVMHAIMSLKQNIEQSKENNEAFHFKEVKCRFCSFRTESQLVLEHHLETPHMKNGLYRYTVQDNILTFFFVKSQSSFCRNYLSIFSLFFELFFWESFLQIFFFNFFSRFLTEFYWDFSFLDFFSLICLKKIV